MKRKLFQASHKQKLSTRRMLSVESLEAKRLLTCQLPGGEFKIIPPNPANPTNPPVGFFYEFTGTDGDDVIQVGTTDPGQGSVTHWIVTFVCDGNMQQVQGSYSAGDAASSDPNLTINDFLGGFFRGEEGADLFLLDGVKFPAGGLANYFGVPLQQGFHDAPINPYLGGKATLKGGPDNDTVEGSPGPDDIILDTGSGDLKKNPNLQEQANGNAGNDLIIGSSNFPNFITAGSGADTVVGGGLSDTITGDAGDDIITGGDGGDFIQGRDGKDDIDGQGGNDQLIGDHHAPGFGTFEDLINGGDGHDAGLLDPQDKGEGGPGVDAIQADPNSVGRNPDNKLGTKDDDLGFKLNNTSWEKIDTTGAEVNSPRPDKNGNHFFKGPAFTIPTVTPPNPLLDLRDEIDSSGYTDTSTVIVKDNNNNNKVDGPDDKINGVWAITGDNDDTVTGSDAGDDSIEAGAGDDILRGLAGKDTLRGGDGDDTLEGGADADKLDGGPGTLDVLDYTRSPAAVDIDLALTSFDSKAKQHKFAGRGGGSGGDAQGDNIVHAAGGSPTCPSLEVAWLTDFNDVAEGGNCDDSLVGGKGDDELIGGGGGDTLDGGEGDDIADGDGGDFASNNSSGSPPGGNKPSPVPTVPQADGPDVLIGRKGKDDLHGGRSNVGTGHNNVFSDTLDGGEGDDTLNGGNGVDVGLGGNGQDRMEVEYAGTRDPNNTRDSLNVADLNAPNATVFGGWFGGAGADTFAIIGIDGGTPQETLNRKADSNSELAIGETFGYTDFEANEDGVEHIL